MSASATNKLRLRNAIGLIYISALMTSLTCVVERYDYEFSPRPSQFVAEVPPELSPTLIEDGLVQARFGPNVSTGILKATRCRPGHIFHLKVFHDYGSVVFADHCRGLMEEIMPDRGDLFVQPLNSGFLLVPVGRDFYLA
jgi:hypothetical protein